MSAAAAALARFVPVALEPEAEPALLWGDLAGVRFSEPFFDQTIERWAVQEPPPRLVSTGFDALEALDAAPSLDPALLIFHVSRCGSTLLSRLLATAPQTLVIAEPRPLNALLMREDEDAERQAHRVRLLARALGRRRFGDERRFVLKLSSWNILRLALFRRAFPAAQLVWVQRDPAEVVASILNDPPGWLEPPAAKLLFGCPAGDLGVVCVGALAAMLDRAREARDAGALIVDYRDLPEAAWRRVAPVCDLAPDDALIARMREEARFSAKHEGRRPFLRNATTRSLPEPLRRLAEERLAPLYRALSGAGQASQ